MYWPLFLPSLLTFTLMWDWGGANCFDVDTNSIQICFWDFQDCSPSSHHALCACVMKYLENVTWHIIN